jgi:3-oxoacyl-[acyl-carrier protein] reductase
VRDVEAAGGSASSAQADVDDMVTGTLATHGRIDTVVVNAHTAPPPFAAPADLSWKSFAAEVTGELAGAFHITKRVLGPMRARGAGRIIYIGSTPADYVGGGRLAHGTAKSAPATFARHVATESARDGVGVLIVAPGAVRTPASAEVLAGEGGAAFTRESLPGRVLEPRMSPPRWHLPPIPRCTRPRTRRYEWTAAGRSLSAARSAEHPEPSAGARSFAPAAGVVRPSWTIAADGVSR